MSRILNIKENVLNKNELKEYLAKLASDNVITSSPEKNTYPIPRLKENCEYISLVYTLLNKHIKIGIRIHSAGEWILDNYYIIERAYKIISKNLTLNKYMKLPGLRNEGFARIYMLANEIISNTDGKINQEDLIEYLESYQTQKELEMEEIYNIGIFLQICIIEKVRRISEKVFISQMQKYKVDNIVERLIENKPSKEIKLKVEGTYPFIEYMSYKLKKYGKISIPYLQIFEEQVRKMGLSVTDAINREHFDIAVKNLSIKNSITSLKIIERMDVTTIFNKINVVEGILNQDPLNIYEEMDHTTKDYYRQKILELSKKTKVSEIFIAEQVLKLAQNSTKNDKIDDLNEETSYNTKEEILSQNNENKNILRQKKSHVGYYLIDEGINELLTILERKKVKIKTEKERSKIYIGAIYMATILITLFLSLKMGYLALLLFIPIQNFVTQISQYILNKKVQSKLIPKMEIHEIPEECATMCIIPSVLKDKEDIKEIINKMEVYYLANKSKNLYFTLLGDCTSEMQEVTKNDKDIEIEGKKQVKRLNEKYGEIFFFAYRKRQWCNTERCYMGWERKRGMISQFNEFLKIGKSEFKVNTCKKNLKIKYIITIDEDTNLILNSVFKLVGAMEHILNKPEVDKIKNIVTKGYGIISPRIGLDINSGRQTTFTRLFAGNGGIDLYTNSISDVYQDNFNEGIFTGKGIYNLDVFYKILKDEIPENTVLSHDLIEGSYLKCGLATDITLIDNFPSNYISYKKRKDRWIRGDTQILKWIKSELNDLSKYKILDNISRNLNEAFIFLTLLIAILTQKNIINIIIPIILLAVPMILKLFDNFVHQRCGTLKHKLFVSNFSKWNHSIYKFLVDFITLPDIAFLELSATSKALYRMHISHSFLLEWTTASSAENNTNNDIISYIKSMQMQIIISIILLLSIFLNIIKNFNISNLIAAIFTISWTLAFYLMYNLGKTKKTKINLEQNEKEYLTKIAKKTWNYFKECMVNYLPSDNYQEDRKEKYVMRTSPTNIGLAMLSAISSYDLKFETKEYTIDLLSKMIDTIIKLPKWNGHLYNWYNIETLNPILPYDISSVDSGNFIGYMYTVKEFLEEQTKSKEVKQLIANIDKIIEETDFSKLYDYKTGLFSIGFNCEQNKLYDSYYDLLASEARQASLIAIAKKDIEAKHWNNLGRTLTNLREHKGLVSWGGTAFEYLMPNINIPTYQSTLIDESCKLLVMSDKEYAKKLNVPWGMSESAYSLKDFYGNYQYKTFGIPWLGLKRGLSENVVISPYSTALALTIVPKDAIYNLKRLEKDGATGKYGFYDSIDYTPKKVVVKTYMAHHQGMILASINNVLNDNIFQKRFMNNPQIKGVKILLEENMPEDVIITKENKDKVEKVRYDGFEVFPARKDGINIISTNELTNIEKEDGKNQTKIEDIVISENANIYIKNLNNNKIYDIQNILSQNLDGVNNFIINDIKVQREFTIYSSKFIIEDGNIKVIIDVYLAPDCEVEIKQIKILNKGIQNIKLEVTTYEDIVLSTKEQYDSHPTFNKMFLLYQYEDEKLFVTRKRRMENEKIITIAKTLYDKDENSSLEFETNKENFISRKRIREIARYEETNKNRKKYNSTIEIKNLVPDTIENSSPFSNNTDTTINPIVAMKRIIDIKKNDEKSLYLITSIGNTREQAQGNIKEYMNIENLERVQELSKSQNEAQIRYMEINEKNIETYQQMIEMLLYPIEKQLDIDENLEDKRLWKYGISGDYPILSVKIEERNDYYIIREILKAYEYMQNKKIKLELVILSNLGNGDLYIDEKMNRYINKRGGIFILNNLEKAERYIIEKRSNLFIDTHNGSLEIQVADLYKNMRMKNKEKLQKPIIVNVEKDKQKNKIKNFDQDIENKEKIGIEEEKDKNNKNKINYELKNNKNSIVAGRRKTDKLEIKTNYKKLKFENEIGTFNEELNEFWIKENHENITPVAWANIMANKKFGTVVTNQNGGYTWYINSRTNRLTKFDNDAYKDSSPEKIIIEEKDNIINENIQNQEESKLIEDENKYICYGFGYSRFISLKNGIQQNITIFVPNDDSVKVSIVRLTNKNKAEKTLKIKYKIDWLLGEKEEKSIISKKYKKNLNTIFVKNNINPNYYSYVTSNEMIDENYEVEITLNPNETKDIIFVLGAEKTEMECVNIGTKFTNKYQLEFEKTKKYWSEVVQKVTSNTPMKSFNVMQNGFLVYQSIVSRMIAKTGFYQSSGGYGYRDQLQDALGMKWVDQEILRNQILLNAAHQFYEGDVEHWWHDDTQLGIRTRCSDDMLFLVYAVEEYIDFTGNYNILNETTSYIDAPELGEDERDRVDFYTKTSRSGTIFEHCLKAIKVACQFGEHGMPLIKNNDWNDGMDNVGRKGKGESIWLGFFLYNILIRFIELIDYQKVNTKKINISKEMTLAFEGHDKILENFEYEIGQEIGPTNIGELNKINYEELKEEFIVTANKLKKALNTEGWDGQWFRRAFNDDGKVIGSIENEECKIDNISQSFAVISNGADNDKKYIAMNSLENYLIDEKNKLVRLLYPALEKEDLGYITAYGKGMRENGGQYTHSAVWSLIAEIMLGRKDQAMNIYKKVNPIEHTKTKEDIMSYKVEPYVVAADIYSEGIQAGRGGWTWYTGSSSWLYEAQIKYILGINIHHEKMTVKPCVPDDWKNFSVTLKWKQAVYEIEYKQTGKPSLSLDGKNLDEIRLSSKGNFKVNVTF